MSNSQTPTLFKLAGISFLAEQLIFLMAFYTLGTSINWPESLGQPADVVFPLIVEQSPSVFGGYYLYMLSSIMLIPMAIFFKGALKDSDDKILSAFLNLVVALGIVSASMKVLGIMRWLFAMPMLANVYLDPDSSEALRQAAVMNYDLLNAYAGKLGEHVGVQLITTFLFGSMAVALIRSTKVSSLWGWVALPIALLSLPYEDLLGTDLGPFLMISGTTIGFWILGMGGYFVKKSGAH